MNHITRKYSNPKQGFLPVFLSDCLDLLDPVFIFDRFMGGIDLSKYLKNVPEHITGRIRYKEHEARIELLDKMDDKEYLKERTPKRACS